MLSHALQQTIPQFAAFWPERFIYGNALDDGFSVMLRLRKLLLWLLIKSFFLLHGNQSPFTNMNSERHWGIQCLKKLQKKMCIRDSIKPLHLGVDVQFIEEGNAEGQIGVGEQLDRLGLGEAHEEGVDILFDSTFL